MNSMNQVKRGETKIRVNERERGDEKEDMVKIDEDGEWRLMLIQNENESKLNK